MVWRRHFRSEYPARGSHDAELLGRAFQRDLAAHAPVLAQYASQSKDGHDSCAINHWAVKSIVKSSATRDQKVKGIATRGVEHQLIPVDSFSSIAASKPPIRVLRIGIREPTRCGIVGDPAVKGKSGIGRVDIYLLIWNQVSCSSWKPARRGLANRIRRQQCHCPVWIGENGRYVIGTVKARSRIQSTDVYLCLCLLTGNSADKQQGNGGSEIHIGRSPSP